MEKRHVFSHEISIITSMFGGSHSPGIVDKELPVRSTAIRGHLRFWWRATRGAACPDAEELHRQESRIFGSRLFPSPVKIWVDQVRSVTGSHVMPVKDRFPAYVAFPLKSSLASRQAVKVRSAKNIPWIYLTGCTFRLNLRIEAWRIRNESARASLLTPEELLKELKPALWAWINFGGIGSRTRRGCGSLYSSDFSPAASGTAIEDWFLRCQQEYGLKLLPLGEYKEWPTLCRTLQVQTAPSERFKAWNETISAYKSFRSFKPNNRRRSGWPEADSLRNITGMAERSHAQSLTVERRTGQAFPRAQLGMPIGFRFKSSREAAWTHQEPGDTEIVPASGSRLASPLLLKVLAVSKEEGYGLIAILNQPPIQGLKLRLSGAANEALASRLKGLMLSSEVVYPALSYKDHPMSKHSLDSGCSRETTRSAVEAFLSSEGVRKWKNSGS
ncbi:type III-B CRISPR module RAMP protein Cmr1 [Paenibacillus sp. S150]|uniref:type III-B CRISPR module RAMP protein Cmr1 n=1 Tax=Paenibacillus sp. S150 TaxID=2749826 RepID=UPI001C596E1A|nr:type III-B CRISPR module RAMP protein Cmr1 [Paenibacillus sp. S150]MBW4082501.1 type III-B CRISPR module RAMP protein Cmr1 [Paenibacillus sp. S150]